MLSMLMSEKEAAMNEQQELLSLDEVAKRFRTTRWTIRRWIAAGKLPAVRIGRSWLVGKDVVERIAAEGISPADVKYKIVRGPAPRFDYFERSVSEQEADKLARILLRTLECGGWPADTFLLKRNALRKIVLGQESAPAAIWRYLADGIIRLEQTSDERGGEESSEGKGETNE
jgi:excisionase family DNA binding protein